MSLAIESHNSQTTPNTATAAAGHTPAASTTSSLPDWICWPAHSTLLLAAVGLIFLYLARTPLWHSDIWDHLNYGRHILSTGSIARTEPLLTICEGVRMVNLPWLAEIALASIEQTTGITGLQFTSALLASLSLLCISFTAARVSRSAAAGLFAVASFYYVNHHELAVLRPQLAVLPLFCLLLAWIITRPTEFRKAWFLVPLLFTLWANLHGSFIVGIMLLSLAALGRAADILRCSRSPRLALLDPVVHRLLLLLQLSAAAILINPFGPAAWAEVFSVAAHPNLANMLEWNPLTLRIPAGQRAAALTLLTTLALGLTPRRVRSTELLILVVTAFMAAWSARMLNWFTPAAALIASIHLGAIGRQILLRRRTANATSNANTAPTALPADNSETETPPEELHQPPQWIWTAASLGIIWLCLALTPLTTKLLRGTEPTVTQLVSADTPVAAVEWLNSQTSYPRGMAFAPAEWAGYLMHRGPQQIRPLVNIHAHLIPEEAWNDYIRLTHGPADWDGLLNEYGINLALVNRRSHAQLVKRMKESTDWTPAWEDRQAVIFLRKQPI